MPTIKKRINITTPKPVLGALERLARRDDVSLAAKTLDLVKLGLEVEEDIALGALATLREHQTKKWISHKEAWNASR